MNNFDMDIDIDIDMPRSRSPSFKRPPPSTELINKKNILPKSPNVERFANIIIDKLSDNKKE